MNDNPEILVVDDIIDAAKGYAELINVKYKLKVIHTSNVNTALEIIKHNNIKVVVLDQVMPEMKGTDLYLKIKAINPDIKALLLTGEASREDVGKAMSVGFNEYLGKDGIISLPEKVLDLYTQYEIDILKKHRNDKRIPLCWGKPYLPFLSDKFSLLSLFPINESFIFEDSWQTQITINVGEETEVSESITVENKVIIEEEIQQNLETELSFSTSAINNLKSKLNTAINKKYLSETRCEINKTNIKKYTLPPIPEDVNQKYIVRKVVESAPVYIEFRVLLERKCFVCSNSQLIPFTLYKQTNKIATRNTDYFSDHSVEKIFVGIHT